MMASQSQMHEADTATRDKMPAAVRLTVFGVVGLLFAGALYLVAVRGQALLVDLSALSQRIFCF
jgi:hypothetical protein